jgi:DNA-binding cell septation regulator SpoVG
MGAGALSRNTTASNNTALGYQAGLNNVTGENNLFVGMNAGNATTSGNNAFVGRSAGESVTSGGFNTLIGNLAGANITTGAKNTVLGRYDGNQGGLDIRTASNYIVLSDGDGNPRGIFNSSGTLLVGRTAAGTALASGSAPNIWTEAGYGITNGTQTSTYNVDRISFNTDEFYIINGSSTGVYLSNGNTSWTSISDERHKDIIEPITDAINKVVTLRAVIGKYKSDEKNTRRSFLIAQDVQSVLPEAVNTNKEDALGLQYTDTIPLLVAAIKELNAKVEAQALEIATLKGN